MTDARAAASLRAKPLAPGRLPALREALRAAGLPADDLEAEGVSLFAFKEDDVVVGYGGLETYGKDALVRSLVVLPAHRRRGVGRRIVAALLAEAARLRASRAYLLTTDAQAYFAALGFAAVDRRAAPPAILATRQASTLCPAAAALMVKATTP